MFEEIALQSGHLTAGVVRINDTVRRPWSNHSEFSAELLKFIQWRGFACAPEYLGRDDQGREMLRYIPGWLGRGVSHPWAIVSLFLYKPRKYG